MKIKDGKLNIVFMGTPTFAVPSLNVLINSPLTEVQLVITQQDKKIGRDQLPSIPPVKQVAIENEIKVLQTNDINTLKNNIQEANPDIIVVIAYGNIIPESILNIPKIACINIHGSLLPKYRGAACVQAAIKNQDKKTGVTIMKMDKCLDTGPIIKQFEIDINKDDTSLTMFDKLSKLGADNLVETLVAYASGVIKDSAQNNKTASYVPMLKKADGLIDWDCAANVVDALFRAMQPWPGVHTDINNKQIKIIEVGNIVISNKNKLGTFFVQDKKLYAQCRDNAIEIRKLQVAGKKVTDAISFMQGYKQYIL